MSDALTAIRDEIRRLEADASAVGPTDAIGVQDYGNGRAALTGSARARDFHWYGDAAVILERLRGLPDRGGPEVIRSEFA